MDTFYRLFLFIRLRSLGIDLKNKKWHKWTEKGKCKKQYRRIEWLKELREWEDVPWCGHCVLRLLQPWSITSVKHSAWRWKMTCQSHLKKPTRSRGASKGYRFVSDLSRGAHQNRCIFSQISWAWVLCTKEQARMKRKLTDYILNEYWLWLANMVLCWSASHKIFLNRKDCPKNTELSVINFSMLRHCEFLFFYLVKKIIPSTKNRFEKIINWLKCFQQRWKKTYFLYLSKNICFKFFNGYNEI